MCRHGRVVAVPVAYCGDVIITGEDQVKTLFLRALCTFAMLGALVGAAPTAASAAAAPDGVVVSSDSRAVFITSDRGDVMPARIDRVTVRVGTATAATAAYRTTMIMSILDKAVPEATAGPVTILGSGTNQKCVTDGGAVVRICITQYWSDFTSGGRRYVKVSKYTGVFRRLDSTWGWKSAWMKAGVNGPCYSGCSFLSTGTTKSIGTPSSGATYTLVPPWSQYYVEVDSQVSHFQHGWGQVTVFRGTRSYNVTTPFVEA